MERLNKAISVALTAASIVLMAATADAIPAFARKYQTSCSTCHTAYPKLNAFGSAFRLNGYRMPEGDEALTKEEDVPLGSEGWKRVWPNGIWPGAIPGGFPFALVIPSQVNVVEGEQVKTDFAFPSEVELFGGGTLGEGFGYYAGVTLIEGNEFGGLHRLYGQFDSLAKTNLVNVRFGFMEPRAVAFSTHRRLTLSNYLINAVGFDINTANGTIPGHEEVEPIDAHDDDDGHGAGDTEEVVIDDGPRLLDFAGGHAHGNGDRFAFANSQRGIELWGATSGSGGGGLEYGVGFVNGNGLGNGEESFDNNSFKDIYWRAAYKFGGMGVTGKSGAGIAEPTQTQNWVDNSLRVGTFGYYGRSPFRLTRTLFFHHGQEISNHQAEETLEEGHGVDTVEDVMEGDETFARLGGDFDLWVGNLNLFGAAMHGRNDRYEFDDAAVDTDFTTWFIQGDYMILPWIVGAVRYEQVNLPAGFLDIERVIPHATFLLRANIKLAVEGQFYRNQSGRDRGLFNLNFAF